MTSDALASDAATLWHDLCASVRRRYLIALVVCLAVFFGTFATVYLLTDRYEANARLLVKLGRENVEVPITVEKGVVATAGVRKEDINSYIQLLKSRPLVEEAVLTVGLDRFRAKPVEPKTWVGRIRLRIKSAVRWLKSTMKTVLITLNLATELTEQQRVVASVHNALRVHSERESNVITVALRGPDPQLVKDCVGTLLDVFTRRHMETNAKDQTIAVFDQKTREYREQLWQLRQQTNSIRERWQLSDPDEQRRQLLGRFNEIMSELGQNKGRLAALDKELVVIKNRLNGLPGQEISSEVIGPNPSIQPIKTRLVELHLHKARTAARYADQSPILDLLNEEIVELEGILAAEHDSQAGETTWRPNRLRHDLETQAQQLRIERAGLVAALSVRQAQIDAIKQDLHRLDIGEGHLEVARLERDVVEQKYRAYAKRREEARIAQLLREHRIANIAVLSAPSVGPEPASPDKLKLLGIALVVGATLGCGLAMFVHWRDDTIYDTEDLPDPAFLTCLGTFSVGEAHTARSKQPHGQAAAL